MKVRLMHPDRDFDAEAAAPAHAEALRADLALDVVVAAMAGEDECIAVIVRAALLNGPENDAATIHYRQAVVRDALAHPDPLRQMYAIASNALETKRKSWWGFASTHPSSILYNTLHVMRLFLDRLHALRDIAASGEAGGFASDGCRNLFAMLGRELDDAWLERAEAQLAELEFPGGILTSAQLGPAFESGQYTLRHPRKGDGHWLKRLLEHEPPGYTVRIAQRDLAGAQALGEMRDRGIDRVANTLAQSADHIQDFFETLRTELAFYVGCINLAARLQAQRVPSCLPELAASQANVGFNARGLRDVSLALTTGKPVIANDIDARGKRLVVVTGANQGGKSTFLRSFGLAQAMTQAGMFVAADAFSSSLAIGVYTHYKREEDATMQQGKLDEELARLGTIADSIHPGAWLLCNESFASTNEREGSELARQMIEAMRERAISVVFVTHLYTFAQALYRQHRDDVLFLRAERLSDGKRTFRLGEGAPRETSYGQDLYRDIFGDDAPAAAAPATPAAPRHRAAQANQ